MDPEAAQQASGASACGGPISARQCEPARLAGIADAKADRAALVAQQPDERALDVSWVGTAARDQ